MTPFYWYLEDKLNIDNLTKKLFTCVKNVKNYRQLRKILITELPLMGGIRFCRVLMENAPWPRKNKPKPNLQTTQLQTTKQSHFCETERRGQYSNERSGPSVETTRKVGESRLTRPTGVWGSRASHAWISVAAVRAFPIGKKKRLFSSVTQLGLFYLVSYALNRTKVWLAIFSARIANLRCCLASILFATLKKRVDLGWVSSRSQPCSQVNKKRYGNEVDRLWDRY